MLTDDVREYNLSLAHGDLTANQQDMIALDRELRMIYGKHPDMYEHIDNGQRIMARVVLRTNRAQEHLRQEISINEQSVAGGVGSGGRSKPDCAVCTRIARQG